MSELVPGAVIDAFVNPVTRSVVKLRPPFLVTSTAAYQEFENRFYAYCLAAWRLARADPAEVRMLGDPGIEGLDYDTPRDWWTAPSPESQGDADG